MLLNAKQIAEYTGGTVVVEAIDPSALLTGMTWDSREVTPRCLFVALPGERVNGHQFVPSALRDGAGAVLVMDPLSDDVLTLAREMGAAVIEVASTFHALRDLAAEWRNHLRATVVAVTGSVGKTTTKNFVRNVSSRAGQVVATVANQNNELGVPKTLLAADPDTDIVVVEMGMRGLGQIADSCELARPDWALVTNVGECHVELLGSVDNVARAKAEIYEALPPGSGIAFINESDSYAPFMLEVADLENRHIRCVGFAGVDGPEPLGLTPFNARVWAEDVELDGEGRPRFSLCFSGFKDDPRTRKAACHLQLQGLHNVANACAAAAIGAQLGLEPEVIASALADTIPEQGRQEILGAAAGYRVINDAYNANPDSVRASLSTFKALDVKGCRYAVLGDMFELGPIAEECHRGVGRAAAHASLDYLICIGDLARFIAEGALGEGLDAGRVLHFDSIGEVLAFLEPALEPDDVVLVKASHGMELNRVVEGLVV